MVYVIGDHGVYSHIIAARRHIYTQQILANNLAHIRLVSTWTPKACKIMPFWAILEVWGPLFYILFGSRYSPEVVPGTLGLRALPRRRVASRWHADQGVFEAPRNEVSVLATQQPWSRPNVWAKSPVPTPVNVVPLRALWSPLHGIWGLLKAGSWGVLAMEVHYGILSQQPCHIMRLKGCGMGDMGGDQVDLLSQLSIQVGRRGSTGRSCALVTY